MELEGFRIIAGAVAQIVDACVDRQSEQLVGQAFHKDNWNAIVRQDPDC